MNPTEFGMDVPVRTGLLVVCLALYLYIYGSRSLKTWAKLGVPGPKPLPFLGNSHKFLWHKSSRLGRGFDELAKKYGKIFGFYYFSQPALGVKDLEALKDVFVTDFNDFTDRFAFGGVFLPTPALNGLGLQGGTAWKRARRIISPSFSISKLKPLARYLNVTASQLSEKFNSHVESGTMPKSKDVFDAYSFDGITGSAFGLSLDTQNNVHGEVFQNVNKLTEVKPTAIFCLFLTDIFPFLAFLLRKMNFSLIDVRSLEFLIKSIRMWVWERKQEKVCSNSKRSDLLESLLYAESETEHSSDVGTDTKWLSSEEVVGQMVNLLVAGYETTSRALQFLTYTVAKHPQVQDRLVEEMERVVGDEKEISYDACRSLYYMEAVILETLRMYPPLLAITRQAVNKTTLKGLPVPMGTAIFTNLYSLGRDPELYEEPNKFNPKRFFNDDNDAKTHKNPNTSSSSSSSSKTSQKHTHSVGCLAFGIGPRHCIGMKFAIMEMKIAMVYTLRNFVLVDAKPDELELDDFNGLLNVKVPIKLKLAKREA